MSQLSKQILTILLVALIAGLALFVDSQSRTREFLDRFDTEMRGAVSAVQLELQDRIERTHALAQLFAQEQSSLMQHLYSNRDDQYIALDFEQKVWVYFPDYLAYSLTDPDGVPVLIDAATRVGKSCRRDLANFAGKVFDIPHAYTPYIHFNHVPDGFSRHFDIMVPWVAEDTGIFFVSIRDTFLQRPMRRFQQAGFQLMLLKASDSRVVELAAGDGIVRKSVKRRLTEEQYQLIKYTDHVEGTLWNVAAMPEQQYLVEKVRSLRMQALNLWLLLLVIIVALAVLWRREASRRSELVVLNTTLGEEVETRKQTESELRKLTNYDPLTTLPNRKSINEFLGRLLAMADEEGHRPAVLFFDIDRFQEFNDTLGHGYGDVMLKEVTERIKTMVRPQDLFARWSGDEFVIVMQSVRNENEVAHFANELLQAMRKPIQLHRQVVTATISIGISIYPEAGVDSEVLLKNADLAMYRAKNEGRDRFRFFLQEMDDIANERIQLETEIRAAIKRDEFEPYFQPRMDVKSGRIIGSEALLRWRHPDGVLAPGAFLPTLEETGMIEAVGNAMRKKVFQHHIEWTKQGVKPGIISLNLGGKEFFRQDIVGQLGEAVSLSGLQACNFEIEITESHLMENTADSLGKLHALKSMGFSIAIDDFGTGYSSLAYLRRFPVNVLKIDRSFIHECVVSPEDQEIIRAIITLAHSLDLHVVAEGVETLAQMEILRGMGCDELQGYFIARPMAAEKFIAFVIDKERTGH